MRPASYLLSAACFLAGTRANPMPVPQALTVVPGPSASTLTLSASGSPSRSAIASSGVASGAAPIPTAPYGYIPFGATVYADPPEGRRIHPWGRDDLCVIGVNDTLIENGTVAVGYCTNNTSPRAQTSIFNLTTLFNTTTYPANPNVSYTGPIAPVNQTELCLDAVIYESLPGNDTRLVPNAGRISFQRCEEGKATQNWTLGIEPRSGAWKLGLNDWQQCATILRQGSTRSSNRTLRLLPCGASSPYQVLWVKNGTDAQPTTSYPNIARPTK